jgi:hypothetical protein
VSEHPTTDLERGLTERLDAVAAAGRTVTFWWRDDDAAVAKPALSRLVDLAGDLGLPLALAVIPEPARRSLARRLERSGLERVRVLQHGFRHFNHEPAGARAAELGSARPADAVLAELDEGRQKLEGLFGERLLPVLTPPWNRVSPEIAARRGEVGLPGLSTFTSLDRANHRLDAHLDPIVWKTTRSYMGDARMLSLLDEEIAARTGENADVPIGILTHHLAHDDAVWAFVETFLTVAARHPAARWPAIDAAFGL